MYKRNEYAHALEDAELTGLVVEVTGLEESATTLRSIVRTFLALTSFANFELEPVTQIDDDGVAEENGLDRQAPAGSDASPSGQLGQLRFSHNIYINLPDTDDVEVFNAIFKALKDNLLR